MHLAVLYACYVGGLPGTGAPLQPPDWQQPLTSLGCWAPSVVAGMLPVAVLLLLVSAMQEGGTCCRCYLPAVCLNILALPEN